MVPHGDQCAGGLNALRVSGSCAVDHAEADRETRISASHIMSPNGILRMSETRFICARKSWHVDHRGETRATENGTPMFVVLRSLIRRIREFCGEVDIAALATIKALPEWHPDREQQSEPPEDGCLCEEPKGLTRN
jgi:hypothetical protein